MLLAYVVSVLVRGPSSHSVLVDGWLVDGFELLVGSLCMARGLTRGAHRAGPLALGAALMCWSIGDIALTVEKLGGANPPSPSIADLFYLSFFPLAYVGLTVLLSRELNRGTRPNWMDGMVAGLGAAALCAQFAFHRVQLEAHGSALSVATNLSYPVADVLLLAMVMTGTALLSGRLRPSWLLVAAGMAVNVAGDTANLFGSTLGAGYIGGVLNAVAWPVSLYLVSLSVWLVPRPAHSDPLPKPAGFVLPGLATAAGLAVLVVATFSRPDHVAVALATCTLAVVGVRLGLSTRTLRRLTIERHQQAITDHLTGLGNRRRLFDVLDGLLGDPLTAASSRMAFLFLDLNHFKEVNDSFGHPTGDELLRQVASRFSACLRESDLLVRVGGDEFAVVLFDVEDNEADLAAVRLTDCLVEPFEIGAVSARVDASIGIAVVPSDATDVARLMWCADVAMYRAKLGGTPVAHYDVHLDEGHDRAVLADELRTAITEGRLSLHYQPQLDLRSGEVSALEALVRWPHPKLGLIPPLTFIPLAAQAGLMRPLTEWVLSSALTQCAAWRAAGRELVVSVNVSPDVILGVDFVAHVGEALERLGLPADVLVLEITETCIIADLERTQMVIAQLRDLGVPVSIDDFGAGFTSLGYLSRLAARELKLDRSFIAGLRHRRERELVRTTIELGHALSMRVVAEGVEDEETLEILKSLGCDLAQGFGIARPKPADQLVIRPHAGTSPALSRAQLTCPTPESDVGGHPEPRLDELDRPPAVAPW